MKELLVISGKGGTGKTTIVASLALLATSKVLADCDVDASDLHLLLEPQIQEAHKFFGLPKAVIDEGLCVHCGRCQEMCRFDAIVNYRVDPTRCEGCQVCYHICPTGAVGMEDHSCGNWYISTTPYGTLIHAALGIAEENSGKLVAHVRNESRKRAREEKVSYILTDGPPGVGCPVIAAMADIDLALIVTEPTISGQHDLERVLALTNHFQVPAVVCINKYGLDPHKTMELENDCRQQQIPILGRIPFRPEVNQSLVQGKPLVKYCQGPAVLALESLWEAIKGFFARNS